MYFVFTGYYKDGIFDIELESIKIIKYITNMEIFHYPDSEVLKQINNDGFFLYYDTFSRTEQKGTECIFCLPANNFEYIKKSDLCDQVIECICNFNFNSYLRKYKLKML